MTEELLPLAGIAIAILILGFAVLSRYLPVWAALAIATIKVAIPFVYFLVFFADSGWTLQDDVRYYSIGAGLVELGYRPWELILEPDGRDVLSSAAASRHTLYYWWNVLAQWSAGTHYYAAVFFNVGLTFLTGVMLFRTLRLLDFPVRFLQGLLVFHMLHWDYLSWISLLNVKEAMVEALVISSMYCIVRFIRLRSGPALLGVACCFMLLFSVRIYVPFLITAGTGLWFLVQWQDTRKWVLAPLAIAALLLLYAKIAPQDQELYPHLILVGAVRYVLTPQPWSIEPSYSFLQIPMILQWSFFVPACLGAIALWQRSRECRLLLLIMFIFIAFYAMFQAHQGPRHRVQLVALSALVEWQFLSWAFQTIVTRGARRRGRTWQSWEAAAG